MPTTHRYFGRAAQLAAVTSFALITLTVPIGAASAASGGTSRAVVSLDPDFGVAGTSGLARFSAQFEGAIAVDAQGRTVVAASCYDDRIDPYDTGICVTRLTADGNLDSGFGDDGLALLSHNDGAPFEFWTNPSIDVIVDSQDRIVVAAFCDRMGADYSTADFCFARFTDDGRPDPGFGGELGITGFTMPQLRLYQSASWIAEVPTGGYVSVGHCSSAFCATRLNEDGSLDSSFGDGSYEPGVVKIKQGTYDVPDGAVLDDQGRLVMVGVCQMTDDFNSTTGCVSRLTPDGLLDPTFGAEGMLHLGDTDIGRLSDVVQAGDTYVAGTSCSIEVTGCYVEIPVDARIFSEVALGEIRATGPEGIAFRALDLTVIDGVIVVDAACGLDAFCTLATGAQGTLSYTSDLAPCEAVDSTRHDDDQYQLWACPQEGIAVTLVVARNEAARPATTQTTTTTSTTDSVASTTTPTTAPETTTPDPSSGDTPPPSTTITDPTTTSPSNGDGGDDSGSGSLIIFAVIAIVVVAGVGLTIARRSASSRRPG